jgi:hypothetical protein
MLDYWFSFDQIDEALTSSIGRDHGKKAATSPAGGFLPARVPVNNATD